MTRRNKPDFFIVGAPKCGTTALNHYLAMHPDVFVAKKEMHFFGSDLRFGPQFQFYRRYPDAYLDAFETWNGQTCAGEASVWYLFSRRAAAEIKAFNPQARIIIMLRNPVAMLHSLYCQFVADGNENLSTFREALAAENDRRQGRRISRQTYLAQALVYRTTAAYTEQVRRYFEVFGRERVHVIIYDDFSSHTADIYRGTLAFLGVNSGGGTAVFNIINGNVNGNKSVRSPVLRAILRDPLLYRTIIALRPWLPRRVFRLAQNTGVRLIEFNSVNHNAEKRAALASDMERLLCREFEPEIERLSVLLGRDLTYWARPERTPRLLGRPSVNGGKAAHAEPPPVATS